MFTQKLTTTQTIVNRNSKMANSLVADILLGFTQKNVNQITEYFLDSDNYLFVTYLNRIPDIALFVSDVVPSSLEAEYLVSKLNQVQENIQSEISSSDFLIRNLAYLGANNTDDSTEYNEYADNLSVFSEKVINDYIYV